MIVNMMNPLILGLIARRKGHGDLFHIRWLLLRVLVPEPAQPMCQPLQRQPTSISLQQ